MSFLNKNIIGIIQARSGSTRLPNKVLLPICGKPSLHYVIERSKLSKYIDKLVLATTTNTLDGNVALIGNENRIDVFRGSENDVLGRFYKCLNQLNDDFDYIVRINADNFLICPEVIDHALEEIISHDADIINPFQNNTYPFGVGAEVAHIDIFKKINHVTANLENSDYREHIFLYAYEMKQEFKIFDLQAPVKLTRPDINVSVDTNDTFEKVNKFFMKCTPKQRITCSVLDIINFYDQIF